MSYSTPSPDNDADIADVLSRTRATLRRAELALDSFSDAPDRERAVAAMCSVVVMGRAVTNVLQQLRSKVQDFDVWYQPWQKQMEQDPLLRYLYKLRSEILKEGREGATNILTFEDASMQEVLDTLGQPPSNAIGFFVGGYVDGVGWVVQLEDGSTEKMYVMLPESDNIRWRLAFENLPGEHLGVPITDDSLENICRLYLQYLRRLVEAAEAEFKPAG